MTSSAEMISQEKIDILKHILNKNGLENTIALFNGALNTMYISEKYTGKELCTPGILNDYFSLSWCVSRELLDFITLDRKLKRELSDAVATYVNGGDSSLIDNYDIKYKENEAYCDMNNNRKLIDMLLLNDESVYNDKKLLTEKINKLLNSDEDQYQTIIVNFDENTNKFSVNINSYDEIIDNLVQSNFEVSKYSLCIAFSYIYAFAYSKTTIMNDHNHELFEHIADMFRTSDGLNGFKLLEYVVNNEWKINTETAKEIADILKFYNLNPIIDDESSIPDEEKTSNVDCSPYINEESDEAVIGEFGQEETTNSIH